MRPYSIQLKEVNRMSVPNNNKWPTIKKLHDDVINFQYTSYPFPNQTIRADIFKTLLQCNINEHKVNKVVHFKCQNIVNLKKIVKIKMKDKKQGQMQIKQKSKNSVSAYSFYFQKVEYSLEHILQCSSIPNELKLKNFNLDRARIKKILAKTIATLFKEGIILFLEFSQIGINSNGTLKIYIPPNVLFDEREYNPKTKILVIKYLNNVLRQIDFKFPKTLKPKNSKQNLKTQQQMSIENDLIANEQSFIIDQQDNNGFNQKHEDHPNDQSNENFFENIEKSINDQQQNFIGVTGSTNFGNLKMQNQIKLRLQKHKLDEKVQQNINNQKKSKILTKNEQKQKINQITHQLQEIRRKVRQKVQQKRQKNLYVTNGFKTIIPQSKYMKNELEYGQENNKNKNRPKQCGLNNINKNNKTSQSSINFFQGLIPRQKNVNCINIYHNPNSHSPNNLSPNNKKHNFKSNYFENREDVMSVDTYEQEIGDDYQMPKIKTPGGLRKTLLPNHSKEQLQSRFRTGERASQQPRFYQSAGGKRFNHIVNLLKPQFQPKKSNIFEEPQENQEQSKKSGSLKKSFGSKYSDKSSLRKKQAKNKLFNSESNLQNQIKGIKTLDQFRNDLKKLNQIVMRERKDTSYQEGASIEKQKSLAPRNPQLQLFGRRAGKRQTSSADKYSQIFVNKISLQEKVRKAMERTKKAIDVLNKARIGKRHQTCY